MKTSLVLLALMTSLTLFANDKGGNGGGGICYKDGKCITLAQAGFRVTDVEVERNTLLTIEVMNELQTVLGLLPSQINLRMPSIIGSKDTIQEVEVADQKRMKSFLKEYRKVLEANGAANFAKDVEIMAFTMNPSYGEGTTYLINGKFDSLSLRGQALILIHEYVLREKQFTLKEALTLDGAILDYINARENNVAPNKVKLIKAASKLFYTNGEQSNGYFFNEALVGKAPLSTQEANLRTTVKNLDSSEIIEVTYDQILRLSKDRPLMSLVNEKREVPVEKTVSRQQFLLGFARFVENKLSKNNADKIIVNDELFSEYIVEEKINADIFEVCGNIEDTSSWLVGNPSTSQLSLAIPVSCSWSTWVPTTWLLTQFDINLHSHAQGGKLNLGRSYECELKDETPRSFFATLTCK